MSKPRIAALVCATLFGVIALSSLALAHRFDEIVTIFFHGNPQLIIGDKFGSWSLWAGANFHIRQGDADRIHINGTSLVTSFTGRVMAPSFQTASSRTGKTAIRALGDAEAHDALAGLRAVSYRRIDDPAGRPMFGFIAEDVPAQLTTPNRDALAAMDFVAVTVTVLQAQQREIAELRAEIAALKMTGRQ